VLDDSWLLRGLTVDAPAGGEVQVNEDGQSHTPFAAAFNQARTAAAPMRINTPHPLRATPAPRQRHSARGARPRTRSCRRQAAPAPARHR